MRVLADLHSQIESVLPEELARAAAKLGLMKEGEVTLGTMDDDEKRMISLLDRERTRQKLVEIEFRKMHVDPDDHDEERCGAIKKQLSEMEARCELMNKILWVSIRARLDAWQYSELSLRSGYEITYNPKTEEAAENDNPTETISNVISDALAKALGVRATVMPVNAALGKLLGQGGPPDDGEPMPGFPGFPFRKKSDGDSGVN